MKAFQRQHHHHHQRINALLIQYAHLNLEQKLAAFAGDVTALANTMPAEQAALVLEKVIAALRVRR